MHVSRQWKIMSLSGKEKLVPKPRIYSQNLSLPAWWNMKNNITCVLVEHGRTIVKDICCRQINRVNETLLRIRGKQKLYYSSGWRWNCILYKSNPRKIWLYNGRFFHIHQSRHILTLTNFLLFRKREHSINDNIHE